ncbi:hypothetical protein Tco_0987510, partial [Tanacetum coccineum]
DGCIVSGEARVQQRKKKNPEKSAAKAENKVFGRILSAKKMKFKITAVGEKVNAAESLLVVSTEVTANCLKFMMISQTED